MKDLIQSSLLVTSARIAGIVLQSLIVILLARALPVEGMGVFALCYAGLGFARVLGPLGADQATMRHVSAARDRGDASLHELLNTSFLLVLSVNGALAAASAVAAFWMPETVVSRAGLVLAASAIPAFALIGLFTYQLRGFDRNLSAQLPDSIVLQLLFGGGVVAAQMRGGLDLTSTFLCLTLSAWAVAAIYILLRLRIGGRFAVQPTWRAARMLLTEGRDVLQAMIVTAFAARAPLLLSAPLLGPAAAAILDIAMRFGTLPTITTSSVTATFAPRFAALAHAVDRAALSRTLSLSAALAAAPALACLAAIALGAPFLIDAVLPAAYADTYVPMLVICLAAAVNAAFGPASTLLFMAGESHIVRNFSLAQLIVICLLAPVLGLPFGPVGLAVAALAGQLVRDFGLTLWARTRFEIALPPFGLER